MNVRNTNDIIRHPLFEVCTYKCLTIHDNLGCSTCFVFHVLCCSSIPYIAIKNKTQRLTHEASWFQMAYIILPLHITWKVEKTITFWPSKYPKTNGKSICKNTKIMVRKTPYLSIGTFTKGRSEIHMSYENIMENRKKNRVFLVSCVSEANQCEKNLHTWDEPIELKNPFLSPLLQWFTFFGFL